MRLDVCECIHAVQMFLTSVQVTEKDSENMAWDDGGREAIQDLDWFRCTRL